METKPRRSYDMTLMTVRHFPKTCQLVGTWMMHTHIHTDIYIHIPYKGLGLWKILLNLHGLFKAQCIGPTALRSTGDVFQLRCYMTLTGAIHLNYGGGRFSTTSGAGFPGLFGYASNSPNTKMWCLDSLENAEAKGISWPVSRSDFQKMPGKCRWKQHKNLTWGESRKHAFGTLVQQQELIQWTTDSQFEIRSWPLKLRSLCDIWSWTLNPPPPK